MKDKTGKILNGPTPTMESYFVDWRNESARTWWLDVKLQSIIDSPNTDGFYWDDNNFGNEHPIINVNFIPQEISEVNAWIQAVRREGYIRLSQSRGFCTACGSLLPTPATSVCTGHSYTNYTYGKSRATI